MMNVPGVARVLSTVRIVVYLLTNQVILKLIMKIVKAVLHVWMNVQRMLFQKNVR